MAEESVTISITEFQSLQETISKLKLEAFDGAEREKKYKQRLDEAMKAKESVGGPGGWFGGNGGNKQEVQDLKKALNSMKKLLAQTKEEHFVQTKSLRENMRSVCDEHDKMKAELERTKADLVAAVSFSSNAPPAADAFGQPSKELTAFEDNQSALIERHEQEKHQLEEKVHELEAAAQTESTDGLAIAALESQVAALQEELKEAKEAPKEIAAVDATPSASADVEAVLERESALASREADLKGREEATIERTTSLDQREAALQAEKAEIEAEKSNLEQQQQQQTAAKVEAESTERQTLQQTLKNTQERLQVLTEEKNKLVLQLADTAVSYEKLKEEAAQMAAASGDDLKETLRQLQEEKAERERAHKDAVAELEAKVADAEQTIGKMGQEVSNAKEELSLTQQDREIIISKMAEQDVMLDNMKAEMRKAAVLAEQDKKAAIEKMDLDRSLSEKKLEAKAIEAMEASVLLKKEVKLLQMQLIEEEEKNKEQAVEAADVQERASGFEELVSLKSQEIRDLRETIASLKGEVAGKDLKKATEQEREETLKKELMSRTEELAEITQKYRRVESELNAMSIRKEEVVSRNQDVIDELKAGHSQEKQELSGQLREALQQLDTVSDELEQAKRKVERLQVAHKNCSGRIVELEEELTAEKTKSGALEETATRQKVELEEVTSARDKAQADLEESEQEKLDNEMQHQVEKKKTQRLVKDLQARLARGAAAATTTSAPPTAEAAQTSAPAAERPKPKTPAAPRRSLPEAGNGPPAHKRQTSAQAAIEQDVAALGMKVGELQKKTFDQQDFIRKQKEKINQLRQQLEKKNLVIQKHLAKLPVSGRATPAMDSHRHKRAGRESSSFMGRLFSGGNVDTDVEAQAAVTAKISAVLEDTILRNVQLQSDMEIMGTEISKLDQENALYRTKFGRIDEGKEEAKES